MYNNGILPVFQVSFIGILTHPHLHPATVQVPRPTTTKFAMVPQTKLLKHQGPVMGTIETRDSRWFSMVKYGLYIYIYIAIYGLNIWIKYGLAIKTKAYKENDQLDD